MEILGLGLVEQQFGWQEDKIPQPCEKIVDAEDRDEEQPEVVFS